MIGNDIRKDRPHRQILPSGKVLTISTLTAGTRRARQRAKSRFHLVNERVILWVRCKKHLRPVREILCAA